MRTAYWPAMLLSFALLGDGSAPGLRLAAAPAVQPADVAMLTAGQLGAFMGSVMVQGIGSPVSADDPPVPGPSPPVVAVEAVPPAPDESPPPKPEPPVLRIRAPTTVDVGHLAIIRFELTGGPVRELSVEIDPPLEVADPEDEKQETAGLVQFEPDKIFISAPAGIRTISVLAIGRDVGFSKQEARVMFKDPRPVPAAPASANAASAQEPRVVLKKFVDAVTSSNKVAELKEVAAAARDVAGRRRAGEFEDAAILEKWEEAAYLRLGSAAFKAWGPAKVDAGEKRRFFGYVGDLLSDNAKLAGANAANLLDSLADILDGK